ncbi:Uncharacterized protein FKW44_003425 [Caligus rogercresseyi]|uniref:Uncharacterized protein n=1 Tax=Caligus rogercresseyi TaxID=217165 RepID=A0A7T8QX28_CALRO|nr:Uncharacterized protein FKW44_003425 [Caligus rogercresseyi]
MEDEDEEDDSHYCLKCRRTIHGLDSYVKHRRERECQARASSPLISANDFFLSLNLMSNHPVVGDVLCSDLLGEEEPSHHTSSNPSKKLNLLSFLKDDPIPEDLPDFIHEEEEVVERGIRPYLSWTPAPHAVPRTSPPNRKAPHQPLPSPPHPPPPQSKD